MKRQLTPLVISLCLIGALPSLTSAAATNSQQEKKIDKLERQVSELQHQMVALKKSDSSVKIKQTGQGRYTPSVSPANDGEQIQGPSDLPSNGPLYLPVDVFVPGQSFVSSGPYIGVPIQFSGSHLVINNPSVNQDLTLLDINKNINQRLAALGRSGESPGSHILFSGMVEGQALYRDGDGVDSASDIDLTTVNLDAFIMGPSSWTSGFMELAYDNNIGTQTGSFSSNDRMLNSRVYINKAFIILGDFQKSPFYSSFGQMFVPFGQYSTTMVSSPLTKILGRTPARTIVIGYKQQAENSLNATAYIFRGPSQDSSDNRINNGGINFDYDYKIGKLNGDVGGGAIANLADSAGMQFTGNNNNNPPLFGGFGGPVETFTNSVGVVTQVSTGNEVLSHRVPAINFHARVGYGHFQVLGEYVGATTAFSSADMTQNSHRAKPNAAMLEAVYSLPWFVNPTSVSIGYQISNDALAIGLPAKRYAFVINRSFWKNTLQSLEFRHDVNYALSNTSSGSEIAGPDGTGESSNMVVLQFDYYF